MFKFAMFLLGAVSYGAGFLGYVYRLHAAYNQPLHDVGYTIFTSLFGFLVVACPLYIGLVYLVDKKFKSLKWLLYPLACVAIFFIPTLLALLLWGGGHPFSSEAQLFYFFYLFSGITFGLGYWFIQKMNLGSFYKHRSDQY